MSKSTLTKSSKDNHNVQDKGRSHGQSLLSDVTGPQADILALQRTVGNQAINQLLQSKIESGYSADGVPPIVRSVLNSGGQPFDQTTRDFMESRFGYDFSLVRVHNDIRGTKSADALNAKAYTVGNDVVFGSGYYQPETVTGKQLLAHELAHVIQQSRGGTSDPSYLQNNVFEQFANQATSEMTQGSGSVKVFGSSGPYLACQPRSLNQPLNPQKLSDEELEKEINQIMQWLQDNPGSSVKHNQLTAMLQVLLTQAAKRKMVGYERILGQVILPALPVNLKQIVQISNLGAGFGMGFLQGARLACPPDKVSALTRLIEQLSDKKNNVLFNLGISVGFGLGTAKGLWDNIVGLYKLAELAAQLAYRFSPRGMMQTAVKDLWTFSRNPKNYLKAETQKLNEYLAIVEGLYGFIKHVESDPAFLLEQGEALGIEAGAGLVQWFHDEFMQMTPFKKGMSAGEVMGRIIIEIVLLFIGPEVLVARGALALGQAAIAKSPRLAGIVTKMLESVPELRRMQEALAAAKIKKEVVGAEKAIPKAEPVAKTIKELPEAEKTIPKSEPLVKSAEKEAAVAPQRPSPSEVNTPGTQVAAPTEVVPSKPMLEPAPPQAKAVLPEMTSQLKKKIEGGIPLGEPELPATAPVEGLQPSPRFEPKKLRKKGTPAQQRQRERKSIEKLKKEGIEPTREKPLGRRKMPEVQKIEQTEGLFRRAEVPKNSRKAFQAKHPPGSLDPPFPARKIEGVVEVDHIVAEDRIRREIEDFARLTRKNQLKVLNRSDNFNAMSKSANASKRNKSARDWTKHEEFGLVDEKWRQEMIKKEDELIVKMRRQVEELQKTQMTPELRRAISKGIPLD